MKLKNKIIISLFISILLILIFCMKVFAVTGTVTDGTVNVRAKADTSSKKIATVSKNDKIEVLAKEGSWYQVKVKSKTGYIYGKYIKVDDAELENDTTTNTQELTKDVEEKLVLKDKTSIRLVPNLSSSVIMVASKDTKFIVIKQMNTWTYISIGNMMGWIRTDKIVEEGSVETTSEKQEEVETKQEEETVVETKTETTTETKTEEKQETKQEETTTSTTKNTKKAYIKYDTVNLREKASATSKILAKLKLNDEVTVLEKVNNVWAKVFYDGKTGYVSQDLLADKKQTSTKTETTNTTSRSGETTSRDESETQTKVAETKKEETTTIATATKTETSTTNKESETKTEKTTSNSKVTGEDIAAYAKQYLSYKYVYGAASPSTGFDCSGLVYYVYKHFGYTLSRSSSGLANCGVKVEKSDLQPGDILIFKNNALTKIGHVGIYIGNNKMIHASEPGVGVIITDIDSKAYKYPQRYVMARRIIK